MLKIAMIAPTCLMHEASKYSDVNMWLCHMFKNPHYTKAVAEIGESKPCYLDNSFFELGYSMPLYEMIEASKCAGIKPTLILPDGDYSDIEKVSVWDYPMMVIPKNQDDLWAAFRMLESNLNLFKVGISCIHAKKALGTEKFNYKTRFEFVESVLAYFHEDEAAKIRASGCLHFLGLNNQPWEEIKFLAHYYEASLDSSAFTWPTIKTHGNLKIWCIDEKYSEPVDFTADLSVYTKQIAIQAMQEARAKLQAQGIVK